MLWEELIIESLRPHNLFYKGDMLIVSYDLGRKPNLTVPFPICFGPGVPKFVHYAVLMNKRNGNIVPWLRVLL